MQLNFYINRLEANVVVFDGFLKSVSDEEVRWRPAEGKWSILEVVGHIADEEIYDFRARLKSVLQDPEKSWEPINPQGWVTQREYNKKNLADAFAKFRQERADSIRWLKTLENPDWNNLYDQKQGKIKAGDLLASWVAHDLFHIRQICRLQKEILELEAKPFSLAYAEAA